MHNNWKTLKLGDIATLITSGSRGWAAYYADEGAKFIRMTNLPRHGINMKLDDMKYVKLPANNSEGSRTRLQEGDVLISITAELGKIGYVPADLGEAYINQHVALVRLDRTKVIPKMVAYILSTTSVRNSLNRRNDSGAKAGLNLPTIQKFPINIPDLEQQKNIVSILETWDQELEKLDEKIALKVENRKGLLQLLLKDRFKAGNYLEAEIQEICEIKKGSGLSKESLNSEGQYDCILYGELYTKYDEVIEEVISKTNEKGGVISRVGDVLIPASTTTSHLDLAIAASLPHEGVLLGGDINILRAKRPGVYDSDFLAYYLSHARKYELAKLAQGITIVHLYGKDFKKLTVNIPPLHEQKKIVEIIKAATREISLLRVKRTVIASQKKHLVEGLVSGEISLTKSSLISKEAIYA